MIYIFYKIKNNSLLSHLTKSLCYSVPETRCITRNFLGRASFLGIRALDKRAEIDPL